jgi:hypothetical protein
MQEGMCLGIKLRASGEDQTQPGCTAIERCTTTRTTRARRKKCYGTLLDDFLEIDLRLGDIGFYGVAVAAVETLGTC